MSQQQPPTRRPWTARVPFRLVILVLAALATLAATGCSEDDGMSPYHPDRGIAGTWVRYQPGPYGVADVVLVPRDTLVLESDGRGRWSYELPQPSGESGRGNVDVQVEVDLPFLFLDYRTCPGCESSIAASRLAVAGPPAAPRRESRVAGPLFRILRDGRNHLELVPLWNPASPQYFRRLAAAPATE